MDISDLLKNPDKINDIFMEFLRRRDFDIATKLLPYVTSPRLLTNYAFYTRKRLPPQYEKKLLNDFASLNPNLDLDLHDVLEYIDMVRERFPEVEPTIFKLGNPYFRKYYGILKLIGKDDEFLKDHPEKVKDAFEVELYNAQEEGDDSELKKFLEKYPEYKKFV
jgi:hypothetical protein